jgi:hypothetical protein
LSEGLKVGGRGREKLSLVQVVLSFATKFILPLIRARKMESDESYT